MDLVSVGEFSAITQREIKMKILKEQPSLIIVPHFSPLQLLGSSLRSMAQLLT